MADSYMVTADISEEPIHRAENVLDMAAPVDATSEKEEIMYTKAVEERLEIIKKARNGLELSIESDEVVTYAIQQQGIPIIDDVCIKTQQIEILKT